MQTNYFSYRTTLSRFIGAICLLLVTQLTHAQLSDLHYLPPLKQGQNNAGIRDHSIYLSTPEPTTFVVNAYRGTNPTAVATFNIDNNNPAVWTLADGDNNITLVDNANTGIVLTNSGLRFESPSGNKFYVNYRGNSSAQAASLTAKGRKALGTSFKWGGVPNLGAHVSKSNTLGIMATEDNTTITLSGYDPNCEFRVGNNRAGITANSHTITLNANESFVYETYIGTTPTLAHERGWIGASIEADKDIVISNGSINYGRQAGASNRDAGIDQPVPENHLGKEYVFIRGNGNTNGSTEFPLIIATQDNTEIFVNGNTASIATLDEGEFFEIPSNLYSANTVGANMYVRTTHDVYAYQCLAGSSKVFTQGLNFVAPVNCLLPDVMDNIPNIRDMAGLTVTGGMTIIAAVNTPDANIQVTDGNGPVALPASNPVAGSADWKTFYIPNLNGNVSVRSTGPMAVGFFGFNGARGVAGYYSGFDTVPQVELEIVGGSGCFVGSSLQVSNTNFDAYQWFLDGVAIPGANGQSYTAPGAGNYLVRGTKGPCTYDSQPKQALYCDPDIIVEKTVDQAEIKEGENATFTIKINNNGVGPLTNLILTDNIPAGLSLVSANTITGSWSGNTWDIGTLNGGEKVELQLTVIADEIDTEPLLSITNTVSHTQDQVDTNTTEDFLSATIIVHNDYDNDGVIDIVDKDDDNDGILDEEECGIAFCFETIVNESFESPAITRRWEQIGQGNIPGWETTSTDNRIEFWSSGNGGVNAFDGNQFAELNATQNSALYQNLCLTPGTVMNWSLRHRGRAGVDQMQIRIGGSLATATVQQIMSTDDTEWKLYSGTYTVPQNQLNTLFIFEAVSTAGGSLSIGNFIDDIKIQVAGLASCSDDDNDGIPNNLDGDSDGDGCSDANEFYKDNNADGGDDMVYGNGAPTINADGTVVGATYQKVLAPEIRLENTTTDQADNPITGGINLGQTYRYALSFQNTGDENATNFSIRDVLPQNVTLDNVILTDAPGVTYNHNPISNEIVFTVPADRVEITDPAYLIRIEVTLSGNCTDFVNACSENLENQAYVTYSGVTNTTVFTDEPGAANLVCATAPSVAQNTVIGNLANCGQSRTVELCGDFSILTAGAGFGTYVWALDSNGNGQIDASETPINDGDPDNDPRTLRVTDIGEYIVEKTNVTGCADLVERITVRRFGNTQTNPVVSFFNRVNTDNNPDNDVQGEVVICGNDGVTPMPKLLLCGVNEEIPIQLGITDHQTITWQKLDESNCGSVSNDCPYTIDPNNPNPCTWTDLAVQDNFTVREAGKYRVVIKYLNGCFSRFHFNVFQNTLDIRHTAEDILCNTPGNIRITNIGSNYGFQLVDATNDNILVDFAAANGPSFDIANSGTYKVQIAQLNPTTGAPLSGSCVFETDDIGILERDYTVNITPEAAACNAPGSISIHALNVLANYNYELRLDDGTNNGQGTLVDRVVAKNDNTHIFSSVPAGNYIVTTTTDDGCLDSQNIRVDEVPQLLLAATKAQDISCNPGLVNLNPTGGNPTPGYKMAIWSRDGTALYANFTDVPDSEKQIGADFLFPTPADAGKYTFVVFDGSDCAAISNEVEVTDLGTVSMSATHTDIVCADSATATLTITATGGTAPYEYSVDGGTTYQSTNTFTSLTAGQYSLVVRDNSGTATSRCMATLEHTIDQPFKLNAAAAIVVDDLCNGNGALVKIWNTSGGKAPYQYSFDGGSTFASLNERTLTAGTYQFVVKDDLGCSFDIDFTVPAPLADPSLTTAVDYNCDGSANITVNSTNPTDFSYTYSLNGTANTPANSNVFNNVTLTGNQTLTVNYANAAITTGSTLFFENFGSGPTTAIAEAGPDYCYEAQDMTPSACNRGPIDILVNGEYTVTNRVTNPVPFWTSPQDHTGLANGRFLAIDVSTFSDTGNPRLNNILWAKRNVEVVANSEVTLSFWAYNLMNVGATGSNPEVLIEILDNSGAIIHSAVATAPSGSATAIPKNNGNTDWHQRTISFDPGANTNLDIVFRSNVNSNDGNDLVMDDITAVQNIDACTKPQDLIVNIEANKAFNAQLINAQDPTCNGATDGYIVFEVDNFDPTTGFEYSLDGTTWTTAFSSPVTTLPALAEGNHTVQVRKVNDTSCTQSFPVTLTAPNPIVPTLVQTADFSCFNGGTGATLQAGATGGNPAYAYQLERISAPAGIMAGYDFATNGSNTIFNDIADGEYIVSVRDNNGCVVSLPAAAAITVTRPEVVNADIVYSRCYTAPNTASIAITVTSGNGDYTFSLNGGAPISPNPATPNTYEFTGLAVGTYTVEVIDRLGCSVNNTASPIVINPILTANVKAIDVSCTDGSITVTPTGGDGNYVYAFVPTGTAITDSAFANANTFAVTNATAGTYDVYVRDHNGQITADPYCQYMESVTVNVGPTLAFTATPTAPKCHDGTGAIAIGITSGEAPFTIELIDIDHGGAANQTINNVLGTTYNFYNLMPGNYTVNITDQYGCVVTDSPINIANPDELLADLVTDFAVNLCTPADGFHFANYPTTLDGTLEFSANGGANWQLSDTFNTDHLGNPLTSGDEVEPAIRTVDAAGNTLCRLDLPKYTLLYPLDNLDISINTIVVNCNELQVVVQGTQGTAPYEYAFTDNPSNFDIATAAWANQTTVNYVDQSGVPQVKNNAYLWTGLIPGRTYVFYVRDDNGCIRQSYINVNDITINPMDITATAKPSCQGANDGEISYNIVDTDGVTEPNMEWELYDVDTGNIVRSSGNGTTPGLAPTIVPYASDILPADGLNSLAPGEYYIVVHQVDALGRQCNSGSENLELEELDPITGTPSALQQISCNAPGLIEIPNLFGGGGNYTFDVSYNNPLDAADPLNGTNIVSATGNNPIAIPANSPSGDYQVTVMDQYGCAILLPTVVSLTLTADPEIHTITVDNCGPATSLTVTSLSTAPLFFSINDGAGFTANNNTGVFNNIPAGNYTIDLLDANGCTDTDTVTVHPSLQANATLTALLGCGPGNEAAITIAALDGSGDYSYEVLDNLGAPVASGGGNLTTASNTVQVSITTAGSYTVNVTDNNVVGPCPRSFTIEVPAAIIPTITLDNAIDATCNGADDGSITVSVANLVPGSHSIQIVSGTGLPVGNFPINAPNGNTTVTFSNLEGSTTGIDYSLQITSANGCTAAAPLVVTIREPETINVANLTVVEYGCTTGNTPFNATVSFATATGGSGNYIRYEFFRNGTSVQNGSNATFTETDLAGGTYTLTVYDDKGCSNTSNPINIAPFDQMNQPTIAVTDQISCTNTGEQIRIDVTGSVTNSNANLANYTFTVLSALSYTQDASNPNVFTALEAGTHTFAVSNVTTGCQFIVDHVVAAPNTFDVTVTKISDVICNGTDGSILLAITDATYTGGFSWNIYNTNGTPADRTDDGLAVRTGTSPNLGPTGNINIPAGDYLVEVSQDAFPECSQVRTFTIAGPSAPLTLQPIQTTDVGCSNDRGTALIAPVGGQGPYTIALSRIGGGVVATVNNVSSHLFQDLAAGDYQISITDALTCNEVFSGVEAFSLVVPDAITGTVDATPLACAGDVDASLEILLTPRNVNTNYRFRLNTYTDAQGNNLQISSASQTTPRFNNLGAGYYRIVVEDDMGCTYDSPITHIANPNEVEALLVTHRPISCQTGAELLLVASGGTGPYEWSLDGNNFNAMNGQIAADTHLFTNVAAATVPYQYFVRDSFNCISIMSNSIAVNEIEDLTVAIDTDAATINCAGDSSALIAATANGGLSSYQYALFSDPAASNQIRPNQTDGIFADLASGTYYVRVQSEDCEVVSDAITIVEPTPFVATPTITEITCADANDGEVTINAQGGSGDYIYAISPNLALFDTENTFTNLAPGDYTVLAQDSKGCFEVIEFTLVAPPALTVSSSVTDEICFESADGIIDIVITGGTAPYSTSLNSNQDGDFVEGKLQYTNLSSGTQVVFVKDANGCEVSHIFEVEKGVDLAGEAQVTYSCDNGNTTHSVSAQLNDPTVAADVLYALDTDDPAQMQLEGTFTGLSAGEHYITVLHSNGCSNSYNFTIEAFDQLTLELTESNINTITALATGGSGNYTFTFNDENRNSDTEFFIRADGIYTVTVTDENGCSVTAEIEMEFIDIEIPNFFTPDGDGLNDTWAPKNIQPYNNIYIRVFDRYGRSLYIFTGTQDGWDGQYNLTDLPTGDYWYIIKLNGVEDPREFMGHFTLYR